MTPSLPLLLAQTAPPEAAPAPSPDAAPPPPSLPDTPGQQTTTLEGQDPGLAPGPDVDNQPTGMDPMFMIIILVGFVLLWVFMIGGQRKEKKRRAAMLAALTKGNRVQTVGGILGTVIEVRENEVVVKVDENSNTRLRFSRSAIQSVIEDKAE